jgi:hypothetical protein
MSTTPEEAMANCRLLELTREMREFYDGVQLVLWWHTPQQLLQGRKPIDMLRDTGKYVELRAMVAGLRDGAFI